MSSRFIFLLLALLALGLPSCRTGRPLLKAKPAALSPFLERQPELRPRTDAREDPFLLTWTAPEPAVRSAASGARDLYIAPISLRHLRPIAKKLARNTYTGPKHDAEARRLAGYFHGQLIRAFQTSPAPRFRVVPRPTDRSVTLELAFTEINPTHVKGNAIKTAAKFIVGPLAGLGSVLTKGNTAIEGKLVLSRSQAPVFQFADNEADKMTFYNLRDFTPYGHATVAIEEWARQFEHLMRLRPGETVGDASFLTLWLW